MHHGDDMNCKTVSREVAKKAAQWLSLMHSGTTTSQDIDACLQWRQANPEHERAWLRAHALQSKLGLIPKPLGMDTLNRQQRYNRRNVIKAFTVLMVTSPIIYSTYRYVPWQMFNADYYTATGEQRNFTLDDGTKLHLNTATSVNVQLTQQHRLITLHHGEILVETGKSAHNIPLIVKTSQGILQPRGTQFIVQTLNEHTRLRVFKGSVNIQPIHAASHTLMAGEETEFNQRSIQTSSPLNSQADAWMQGVFYANSLPLGKFIEELARYYKGTLRCDPTIANLRISGVFQLNNIKRILTSLPDTLPVELNSFFGLLITIKAR
jgi:transmembrane sensor